LLQPPDRVFLVGDVRKEPVRQRAGFYCTQRIRINIMMLPIMPPTRFTGLTMARLLAVLALSLVLGSCNGGNAAAEYERQLKACSLAEGNGLLDSAVLACTMAFTIAEEQAYAPDQLSALLFRLAQLERQRGNFQEAQSLLQRSLAIEDVLGVSAATATRLIELALILAGLDRWLEGAELLEQATPLLSGLTGEERKAAANAFRGYSVRLEMLGYPEPAERFSAVARQLNGS
jgi:tetratricopeptide (TPR) repeat protein